MNSITNNKSLDKIKTFNKQHSSSYVHLPANPNALDDVSISSNVDYGYENDEDLSQSSRSKVRKDDLMHQQSLINISQCDGKDGGVMRHTHDNKEEDYFKNNFRRFLKLVEQKKVAVKNSLKESLEKQQDIS